MFSGMRLNEVCQLYKEDVREVNGILCFSIDDDKPDKRLKNMASRRNVPIHPKLIEIGLKQFIKEIKGERLFPDLRPYRDGYGHSFKHFMPLLRKHVTTHPKKTFHSFRHGVATLLSEKAFPSVWRADLLGHQRPGNLETDLTYTHRTRLEALVQMVNAISYDDVDFSKCCVYPATDTQGVSFEEPMRKLRFGQVSES
jgi:integrase